MKKIISLLFIVLISYCGFSQSSKVITMKSNMCFIDKGGDLSKGENQITTIHIYDNLLKLKPNDRLLPRKIHLKNPTTNIGEHEIGKFIVYQYEIDDKPPTRYVTVYHSKVDNCYYLEIEHSKYSELLKIK